MNLIDIVIYSFRYTGSLNYSCIWIGLSIIEPLYLLYNQPILKDELGEYHETLS